MMPDLRLSTKFVVMCLEKKTIKLEIGPILYILQGIVQRMWIQNQKSTFSASIKTGSNIHYNI